jgi:vacuolar-type H+-ATPase subunit I/STV1
MKLRHVLCTLEPKYKKKAKYATAESDIDDEWVAAHETELEAKEVEKVEKKFEKDNEKRAADGDAPLKQGELDERVAAVREEYKRLRKEQGTGKATLKRERPVEKLEEAIGKLEERIAAARLQMVDREEGKEVALTTSKINYLDPRYVLFRLWDGRRTHDTRAGSPRRGARSTTCRSRSCFRRHSSRSVSAPAVLGLGAVLTTRVVPWALQADEEWKF